LSSAETSDPDTIANPAFEAHYRSIFGERWTRLRRALCEPARHAARLNSAHPEPTSRLPDAAEPIEWLPGCRQLPPGESFPPPPEEADVPRAYYPMDAASVWAARVLQVESGDRVLDTCAAPGGKTLVLAEAMGERGFLVANDRSSSRRARLHDVLETHLPAARRERIRVTGHDATKWGLHQQNLYDRILVDAPCSGERHLLDDPARLRDWSDGRPERMAHRQYPMLCAALDAVRVGGRILYSTCALSPTENDEVVERLLERSPDAVDPLELDDDIGESTTYGRAIRPDTSGGWGPMFVAALERIA
jgi:16S rRNA C967 or C1407 C5-methylase (RsmB/RsmF family)